MIEGSNESYEFLAQLVEWDAVIGFLCILHFCPICFVNVGVRLVLFHDRGRVLKALETVFDVFWHRDMHLLVWVIPLNGEALLYLIRYLKLTRDIGLRFSPNSNRGFDCYVDADFAGINIPNPPLPLLPPQSTIDNAAVCRSCCSSCPILTKRRVACSLLPPPMMDAAAACHLYYHYHRALPPALLFAAAAPFDADAAALAARVTVIRC